MRFAAFGLQCRFFSVCKFQRLAAIDRRQTASKPKLAPAFKLVCRLVAGIEKARRFELFHRFCVDIETLRLIFHTVRPDAQPVEIDRNSLCIFVL